MISKYCISVAVLFTVFGHTLAQGTPEQTWSHPQKRQFDLGSLLGGGVIAKDPPGAAPRRVELKTDSSIPGVQRVKIRYGPYNAPNMKKVSFPTGEHGMLWNFPHRNVEKPCSECVILKQWAGLEYPDGSVANVNSGLWLHHMVHFVDGPSRWDPVCYGGISLPHVAVMASPNRAERYYFCGNERTAFDYNPGGKDLSKGTGYQLTSADRYHFLVDLMNMNMEDKLVYMTMTYDFLPGQLPPGWNNTKTFWLDAASCTTSEVYPPKQNGKFTIQSPTWTPNFEGRLLHSVGHLHDGGLSTTTMVTPTQPLCVSTAGYNEEPGFHNNETIRANMGHGNQAARSHISSMSNCAMSVSHLKRDQRWKVVGNYDYDKYDGNSHAGKQAEVMAISVMVVEVPREGVPRP